MILLRGSPEQVIKGLLYGCPNGATKVSLVDVIKILLRGLLKALLRGCPKGVIKGRSL